MNYLLNIFVLIATVVFQVSALQTDSPREGIEKKEQDDLLKEEEDYELNNDTSTDDYLVQIVMHVPTYVDIRAASFKQNLEMKLERAVQTAFATQQSRHLGQPTNEIAPSTYEQSTPNNGQGAAPIGTKMVKVSINQLIRNPPRTNRLLVSFLVYYDDFPVAAQVVVDDLNLISISQISTIVGYHVDQIAGGVIGGTLAILFCGWCILFAYYNTCGRPIVVADRRGIDLGKTHWRSSSSGGLVLQPTDFAHETSHTNHKERAVQKIYMKEEPVQTDITGGGSLEQRLDDLGLTYMVPSPVNRHYAPVHIPERRSRSDNALPTEKQQLKRTKPGSESTSPSQSAPHPDSLQHSANHVQQTIPSSQEHTIDSGQQPSVMPANQDQSIRNNAEAVIAEVPTDPQSHTPIKQQLEWSPHFAGDQVEHIFQLYHRKSEGNPRPMPATSDGAVLELHSRELGGGGRQLSKEEIMRNTLMQSLHHII